jgi:hypothetical protein
VDSSFCRPGPLIPISYSLSPLHTPGMLC